MTFKYKHIILGFLALMTSYGYGQKFTKNAYEALQADDLKRAKVYIDSAVADPQETQSAQTWRFKGYIYKQLEDINNPDLEIREDALKSFLRSNELDKEGRYKEKNDKSVKGIVLRYYNESVIELQQNKDFTKSNAKYNKYKQEYHKYVDENYDFTKGDIDYYNAYATELSKKIDLQNQKEINEQLDTLLKTYEHVLKLDSNNYNANYNIAIIYYNIGVEMVYTLNPELELEELVKASKKCVYFFKKSLPYMQVAYQLNPEREETIEGLHGIHLNLNNEEKANHYKKLLDELRNK